MRIKKNVLLLGMIFVVVVGLQGSLFAASLSSIETQIQNESESSDTQQVNRYGKYKTNVELLNQRAEFIRKRFFPRDLMPWVSIYQSALSFELFNRMIQEHKIARDGEVLVPTVVLGNIHFKQNELISLTDLKNYYRSVTTPDTLFYMMQSYNILSESGYLAATESFSTDFDKNNYSFVKKNVDSIDLTLDDQYLESDLKGDLYRFILNEHTIVRVEQKETTRYESSQESFFPALVDSFVGSAVGSVVHPDKISVVRQKVRWLPNVRIADYFDFLFGFNQYPYRGNKGVVLINGRPSINQVSVLYSNLDGFPNYFGEFKSRHSLARRPNTFFTNHTNYFDYGLIGNQLSDDTGNFRLVIPYIGFGSAYDHFMWDFNFGLAVKSYSHIALGFAFSGDVRWYPVAPIGLQFHINSSSQQDFLADVTLWEISQTRANLNFHVFNSNLQVGYQWYSTAGTHLNQGWFGGVEMVF